MIRNRSEVAGQDDAFSIFQIKNRSLTLAGHRQEAGRTKDQLKLWVVSSSGQDSKWIINGL